MPRMYIEIPNEFFSVRIVSAIGAITSNLDKIKPEDLEAIVSKYDLKDYSNGGSS